MKKDYSQEKVTVVSRDIFQCAIVLRRRSYGIYIPALMLASTISRIIFLHSHELRESRSVSILESGDICFCHFAITFSMDDEYKEL